MLLKILESFGKGIECSEIKVNPSVKSTGSSKNLFRIADGINCPKLHDYLENNPAEFNKTLQDVRNYFIENTTHITEEQLEIQECCEILGLKKNDGKIVPPIFYKFGLLLNQIATIHNNDNSEPKIALEIGAGYGGFPTLFTKHYKKCKYIIVDIQPTVSIAAFFLSKMGRSITLPHEFTSLDAFLKSTSDILFIYADQLNNIPNDSIDLVINMDSIVELNKPTITFYIDNIKRILKKNPNSFFISNNMTYANYPHFIETCEDTFKGFGHVSQSSYGIPHTLLSFEFTMSDRYHIDIYHHIDTALSV